MANQKTMDIESIAQDIATLPTEAQEIIADLVRVLKERYQTLPLSESHESLNLEDQPFVGMWENRSETQDSTGWVRQIRQQQWRNPNGTNSH